MILGPIIRLTTSLQYIHTTYSIYNWLYLWYLKYWKTSSHRWPYLLLKESFCKIHLLCTQIFEYFQVVTKGVSLSEISLFTLVSPVQTELTLHNIRSGSDSLFQTQRICWNLCFDLSGKLFFMILFLTFLDHLGEVWLSEHFGHPEDHQRVFDVDQICPDSSVQKDLKELGVHEQVLLNERLPAKENVCLRTSSPGTPLAWSRLQENEKGDVLWIRRRNLNCRTHHLSGTVLFCSGWGLLFSPVYLHGWM